MSPTDLELWQTEWCPDSHRVRQRMTELGLDYLVRQVAVDRDARPELVRRTGQKRVPTLVARGEVILGEDAIVSYLNTHFTEPPEGAQQRAIAALARQRDLEEACRELSVDTASGDTDPA